MKEINLFAIQGFKIGHAQDENAGTGISVFLFDDCFPVGVDIRGGGPASRETPLLSPYMGANGLHALVLSGGSAFGLDASGGVLQFLEERNIGFDTGITKVPLVCQSCIFDLALGEKNIRPTKEMAYQACINANNTILLEGNIGVGIGASVGKMQGMDFAMKSGVGVFAVEYNGIQVGAFVVNNALGDIYHPETNKKLIGMYDRKHKNFLSSNEALLSTIQRNENLFQPVTNTCLGIIFTNAQFNKAELGKISSMTYNALAKTISPVHTMADGDTIYTVSTGKKKADINAIGLLSTLVMEKAIVRSATQATSLYGLPSYQEI